MKIKMKVKHLTLIITSVVLLTLLTFFIILPQFQLYSAEKQANADTPKSKAAILQILEDDRIFENQKWRIIGEYLLQDPEQDTYEVVIAPSFTQINSGYFTFTLEEVFPYVKAYVDEGPIDDHLVSAAVQLASYYEKQGELEQANSAFERTLARISSIRTSYAYLEEEAYIAQIDFLIRQADYEAATQLLIDISKPMSRENYDLQARIRKKQAEIAIQEGNTELALDIVTHTLTEFKEKEKEEREVTMDTGGHTAVVYESLLNMKERLENKSGEERNTVTGRVVYSDGTPAVNVGVILKHESDIHYSGLIDEPYREQTDIQGYYTLDNVAAGSYQLVLGFSFEQIDGWTYPAEMTDWIDVEVGDEIAYNIELQPLMDIHSPVNQETIKDEHILFSWDPVKGAAYYQLNLALDLDGEGAIGNIFRSQITDSQLEVPVEELYSQTVGISFSGDDADSVDPRSLLAFSNTENRFSWTVEAYDADGDLITQSNGYRLGEDTIGNLPFFYIKERSMTEADQLLLDKKLEEALETYKADYKDNPDDMHSLRMITRLIGLERFDEDTYEIESEKAIPYLIELADKTNSSDAIFRLVEYFYGLSEWDELEHWYKSYATNVNDNDDYVNGIYAIALMKQGKLDDAKDTFATVTEQSDNNDLVGYWLAIELYDGTDFADILNIAKTYPERPFAEAKVDWARMIQAMEKENGELDNYHDEIEHVFDLFFQEEYEEIEHWRESTDMRALKAFVEAVMEVE
ncbi:carboxypeptidase-like regulatory domain-containing protein [Oceanobacillus kimchii]|uniref:carboxypeptidase-like regulatory domain-containing protein n=1 Tax=Oceanobacillus kimchii TaxID=746691 RepID=UPI0021A92752|nr:carboxypeptidase-like regulatory domain-containing protein [Oceanobacillus kimchii]MCT1577030.1 carboxypeptidase-like regulatory domain-containing protein [Oceanobacillus kimchii]MCT2135100.1 carboxypeptidase-like regulatory domain-containing protein [Oceanobacillus kimchii]